MTQDVVLPQIVRLLASAGLPRPIIVQNLRKLADLLEAGRNIPIAPSRDYDVVVRTSSVMHDWTRSPEYTGDDGEPRALVLRGRRGLSVLIRRHFPRQAISSVLKRMTASGAVRRRADGRYVLLHRHMMIGSELDSLEWMAMRATQYLNAAFANWKEGNPSSRQLDRIARVFDLPEKEVPHFREFSKSCTESWIEQIDNWLEDHSQPQGRQRRVEAGVHVYGYVGTVQNGAPT